VRRAAQVNAHGVATQLGSRQRSWAEFEDRIACLAGALRDLGVEPGQRVAMLALNSDRYLEYFFAVAWSGGVFVPINTRLALPEIVYWLEDSGSRILFLDASFVEHLPEIRARLAGIEHFVFVGDGPVPEGCLAFEELISSHAPVSDAGRTGDDLAGLFYTGGTTGRSKGVMLSHRNLVMNALQMLVPIGLQEDDTYLHAAPMFHLADGLMSFAATTLAARHVFIEAFEPEAVLRAIEEHRVTRIILVPTMINMLVHHPKVSSFDLSSLRGLVYGASPMPEAVIRRAMEVMPEVGFYQCYGQTESAPALTVNGREHHDPDGPRLRAAGVAVPGVEISIQDEQGSEVPRGTVGEICAKGENVMLGYWKLEDETRKTLRGGWLHTGDGGFMDEDGVVTIVDRVKDMIISGGENVYSAEVESAVHQHPAVAECAVIGIPHEKWGEQVHAIVCLHEAGSVDADELIAHCKSLIAGFKCPRSVDFREEPLPLSGAGKILKKELRAPFWKDQDRAV
jgi:long-chain acyl-CoA synthetase